MQYTEMYTAFSEVDIEIVLFKCFSFKDQLSSFHLSFWDDSQNIDLQ